MASAGKGVLEPFSEFLRRWHDVEGVGTSHSDELAMEVPPPPLRAHSKSAFEVALATTSEPSAATSPSTPAPS